MGSEQAIGRSVLVLTVVVIDLEGGSIRYNNQGEGSLAYIDQVAQLQMAS